MIKHKNGVFYLETKDTSYIFQVTKFGHLEHIYYGEKIEANASLDTLTIKRSIITGSCVVYDESDEFYCLDVIPLEYSGIGKGDYRHSPLEVKMPDTSFVSDFIFQSYEIISGAFSAQTLPGAYCSGDSGCDSLIITLKDKKCDVLIKLIYGVYEKANVITRRAVMENKASSALCIRKFMSMMIDMPDEGFSLLTIDGGWIKEAHRHDRKLNYGVYVNESLTGASSNRHNPGIMLYENDASEDRGRVYGFNLIYSGNHYEAVEKTNSGLIRIMSGINPQCFEWKLKSGESFETPEAILTFSSDGFNKASQNFHDFVNNNIVRGEWKDKERPVLINNWESCFFNFTHAKLVRLARRAKKLGVELFVLDDGWFGERDNDAAGLGDYHVNKRKLPGGLKSLSKKINKLGMRFGLWFEPEMVNENSSLYRTHPEYAVKIDGRKVSYGRNQLVLDLCNPEVRDYIVKSVRGILDSADIAYVKWDMNRHISDMFSGALAEQGTFYHRYILGLYDILKRIFSGKEDILLESCSSGGNRFDLGMLCFSPQIWASDDTDCIERLEIQRGLSYFYPPSTMGSHLSEIPSMAAFRNSPLSTRFDVAAFGAFGFELDIKYLSHIQKKHLKERVEFYKKFRRVFQFGKFYRYDFEDDRLYEFMCVDEKSGNAVAALFQKLTCASPENDILKVKGLDKQACYSVESLKKHVNIKRLGSLINFLTPFHIDPDGVFVKFIDKHFALTDVKQSFRGKGSTLMQGIRLNNQFMGTGYNASVRLMGDFGSDIYIFERDKLNGKLT